MTDVVLQLTEHGKELHGVLQCSSDIFSRGAAQRLLSSFKVVPMAAHGWEFQLHPMLCSICHSFESHGCCITLLICLQTTDKAHVLLRCCHAHVVVMSSTCYKARACFCMHRADPQSDMPSTGVCILPV